MLFRSGKAGHVETEEEEIERVHFISPSTSQGELDKEIEKWTNDQIQALLKATPNNVLQTFNFALSREDFLDVTNIAQNYTRVRQFTKRRTAQQTRIELIKKHGFDSSVYLAKLIEDQRSFEAEEKELFNGIIQKLNINDKIYEVSFESFVGDEEVIDLSFVKAHMELLSYHPVKQQTPTDPQTGRAQYFASLKGAL